MKQIALLLIVVLALVGCTTLEPENVISDTSANDNTIVNEETNTETNVPSVEENTDSTGAENEPASETNTSDTSPEAMSKETIIAIDAPLPDFKWETLDGYTISPNDYTGKIVMINFWATWCPYCIEEMPDLEKVNAYDDVVVLAVNSRESVETIEGYLEKNDIDLDIILDVNGSLSSLFYVNSLPTTFFLNEEGLLLGGMPGMMSLEQMEQIIQDIRDDVL